jgi:hypothetical protein
VDAQQVDAVRRALAVYAHLEVSIANEHIVIEGRRAQVSFDRSDVDEKGKTLRYPRQSFRLEKGPNGLVAVGRGPTGAP